MSKQNDWDTVTEKLLGAIKTDNVNGVKEILTSLNSKEFVNSLLDTCTNISDSKITGLFTPLHFAVFYERIDVVKCLLDDGMVCVDQVGDVYMEYVYQHLLRHTALCHAIKINGKHSDKAFEIAKLLIERYGADVNLVPKHGFAPLLLACSEGDLEMVKLLISNGAKFHVHHLEEENADIPSASQLLMISVEKEHVELVEYLIQQGVTVNEQNDFGHTPLHICTNAKILDVLLQNGATLLKDRFGMTPLQRACMDHSRESHVQILLTHFQKNQELCKQDEIISMVLVGLSKLQFFDVDNRWLSFLTDIADKYGQCKEWNEVQRVEEKEVLDFVKEVTNLSKSGTLDEKKCFEMTSKGLSVLKKVLGENYPSLPFSLQHLVWMNEDDLTESEWEVILKQLLNFYGEKVKPLTLESVAYDLLNLGTQVPIRMHEYDDPASDIEDINKLFFPQIVQDCSFFKFSDYFYGHSEYKQNIILDSLAQEMLILACGTGVSTAEWTKFKEIMKRGVHILNRLVSQRKCPPCILHSLCNVHYPTLFLDEQDDEKEEDSLYWVTEIIKVLPGLDVNSRDRDGNTPLHVLMNRYSEQSGYSPLKKELLKLVKLLLERGARVDVHSHDGKTPYDCIQDRYRICYVHGGDPDLKKLLKPKGKVLSLQRICVPVVKEFRLHLVHSKDLPENLKAFLADY